MEVPARFGESLGDNSIRCKLCPIECVIPVGGVGVCRYRANLDGKFYLTNYGNYVDLAVEPIEKKPLFHYYPGTKVASIGTNGCNMGCTFCQNYLISQKSYPTKYIEHSELLDFLQAKQVLGLCYTFNEPLVWYEYLYDSAAFIRKHGFKVILNTNGLIQKQPLLELLPLIDALNLDLKGFSDNFYLKVCKAPLQPVLETAALLKEHGKFFEISHLIICGENDTETEPLGRWILDNLGNQMPIHLNAYYPRYMLTAPATSSKTIEDFCRIYRDMGHKYVYAGNTVGSDLNTYCVKCNGIIVNRTYNKYINLTKNGMCPDCNTFNNIVAG